MKINFSTLTLSNRGTSTFKSHDVWRNPHFPKGPNTPEDLKNPNIEFKADGCTKPGYVWLDGVVWEVKLCANIDELKGWLRSYAKDKPQEAMTLLKELQDLVMSSRSGEE